MNQVRKIVIAILVVLGAAAGAAKVLQMPQELEFFEQLNLGPLIVVIFGVVQIMGAVLLSLQQTRLIGAIISDITFTLSAVMIFFSGSIGFALVALIPAILAGAILIEEIRTKQRRQ